MSRKSFIIIGLGAGAGGPFEAFYEDFPTAVETLMDGKYRLDKYPSIDQATLVTGERGKAYIIVER